MGFNFGELQQTALRVIHNADEFVRKWIKMTLAPPQDVTVEYYDQNGNLITETIPNYRKQLNALLGDKKHLVYLYGGNITTLQELEDFLNNIPAAGRGIATIAGNIFINKRLEILSGKVVDLIIDCDAGGKLTFQAYTDTDGYKKMGRIYVADSSLTVFMKGDISYAPIVVDTSTSTAPWTTNNLHKVPLFADFNSWLRISKGSATISVPYVIDLLDSEVKLAIVAKSRLQLGEGMNIRLATSTQIVLQVIGFAGIDAICRLLDSAGNDLYTDANNNPLPVKWRNHTIGLVYERDANNNILGIRNLVTAQDFINT